MKSIKNIGLTGGIASGKTIVLNQFKKLGVKTISCDEISKKIFYEKNISIKIRKLFGTLDRKKIAKIIFSDFAKRKQLEKILHPEIIKELKKQLKLLPTSSAFDEVSLLRSGHFQLPAVIVDVPLLFEADISDMFGKIIVVYCPKSVQIKRLAGRDRISVSDAKKRIRSQMPMREKIKMADYVVDNSGNFADTKKEIKKIKKILDKLP